MNSSKIAFLIPSLLCLCLSICAQNKPPKGETFTYNNVQWNTLTHDFGDMDHNKPAVFEFKFTNLTKEPLLIDNVRTTCGCTAPTWSYDPTAPGETAIIEIEFDAKQEGVFEKFIKVFFKGQRYPDVLLVEGEVGEAVIVEKAPLEGF